MSLHWGVRALLRAGVSRSGGGAGAQADLERLLHTEGGASAGTMGRCPRCSGQGGRRAEQSKNEGSEGRDRAGGAWGHSSKRRRRRGGLTWSEVYNETPVLCRNQAVSGEG